MTPSAVPCLLSFTGKLDFLRKGEEIFEKEQGEAPGWLDFLTTLEVSIIVVQGEVPVVLHEPDPLEHGSWKQGCFLEQSQLGTKHFPLGSFPQARAVENDVQSSVDGLSVVRCGSIPQFMQSGFLGLLEGTLDIAGEMSGNGRPRLGRESAMVDEVRELSLENVERVSLLSMDCLQEMVGARVFAMMRNSQIAKNVESEEVAQDKAPASATFSGGLEVSLHWLHCKRVCPDLLRRKEFGGDVFFSTEGAVYA